MDILGSDPWTTWALEEFIFKASKFQGSKVSVCWYIPTNCVPHVYIAGVDAQVGVGNQTQSMDHHE